MMSRTVNQQIAEPTGRGATKFVACSNASLTSIMQADVFLPGTDDYPLIASVIATMGPGTLRFSEGNVWLVSGYPVIKSGQYIQNSGRRSTTWSQRDGANLPYIVAFDKDCYCAGFMDAQINGNVLNNPTGTTGIYVRDTNYLGILKNLEIVNLSGRAITVEATSADGGLDSCWWENILCYNCSLTDHIIYIYGANSACHFEKVSAGNIAAVGFPTPASGKAAIYFDACSECHGHLEAFGMAIGVYENSCSYMRLNHVLADVCEDYGLYSTNGHDNTIDELEIYAVGQNGGAGIAVGVNNELRGTLPNIQILEGLGRRSAPYTDVGILKTIVETGTTDYMTYGNVNVKTQMFASSSFVGLHNQYGKFSGNAYPTSYPSTTGNIPNIRKILALIATVSPPAFVLPPGLIGGTNYGDLSGNGLNIQSKIWFDKCFAYASGVYTDETTASMSNTTNDMTLLAASPVVNDEYIYGRSNKFSNFNQNVGTAGTGTWTITYKYWSVLTGAYKTVPGLVDNTAGWHVGGSNLVTFTPPNDWGTETINGYPGWYLHAVLSSFTNMTVQPKGTNALLNQLPQYFQTPMSSMGDTLFATMNGLNEAEICFDNAVIKFGNGLIDSPFTCIIVANPVSVAAVRTILGKWNLGNGNQEFLWTIDAANHLRVDLYDKSVPANPYRLSNGAITLGAPTVLIFTYDGSGGATAANGIALYQDSVVIASTATNVGTYVAMEDTGADMYLDALLTATAGVVGSLMQGDVSWRIILPVQLTAAQVLQVTRILQSAIGK